MSQFFANFYLTYFDHWLKEVKGVKYYYRYCDDLVILGGSKELLHDLFKNIVEYLYTYLKLQVKGNYQIFPVESRGIDFVGYKHYHKYTLLRKSIKLDFIQMLKYRRNKLSIASYNGWLSHCNSVNLINKYLKYEQKNK